MYIVSLPKGSEYTILQVQVSRVAMTRTSQQRRGQRRSTFPGRERWQKPT